MLNEDIFSKEVEEQLKYLRTGLQNGNKTHYPINLCFIDTHGKIFELKETFKRLEILDDIAKSFDIGYVLHFEEQTFIAVFNQQENWSDNCYQQAINFIGQLHKKFQKLKILQSIEDNLSATLLFAISLSLLILFSNKLFSFQMQINMTSLGMLGLLITSILVIADLRFKKYIENQKSKLDNNFKI